MTDLSPPPTIDTTPITMGRVSITPNLLTSKEVAALRADAKALFVNGVFVPGGLRRRSSNQQHHNKKKKRKLDDNMETSTDETTRICDICGIFDDAEKAGPNVGDVNAREDLLDLMSDLRELLQHELDIQLSESMELQYLRYPGGGTSSKKKKRKNTSENKGFYGRHFDSDPEDANTCKRKISLLLYLNEDGWDAEKDGGILRAYIPQQFTSEQKATDIGNGGAKKEEDNNVFTQDIVPEGGKLVLFDSASVEHEVLPTCKERWAVVGWFLSANNATTRQRGSGDGDKKRSTHHSEQTQHHQQPRKRKKKKRRKGGR